MRTLLALVVFSSALSAQAAAPSLSEVAALRLQNFELKAESIVTRVAALQAEFMRLQGEHAAYVATLQRDGYTLKRGDDGTWVYVPHAKEPQP